jgi:hypothetical protein
MRINATLPYRIASILFFIFAVSHTFGVLSKGQPSPEVAAVRSAMDSVRWQFMGSDITYGKIYVGFGLFVTAALLLDGFLAWHLGTLARTNPQAVGSFGWVFFGFGIASLILSWVYFFTGPIVVSALIAICLGGAAYLVSTAKS